MLAGLTSQEKQNLELGQASNYYYLTQVRFNALVIEWLLRYCAVVYH